jgi:hypothetical protein
METFIAQAVWVIDAACSGCHHPQTKLLGLWTAQGHSKIVNGLQMIIQSPVASPLDCLLF